MVSRARRCSLRVASLDVRTGVTHASIPARMSVHSSRVLATNRSANSVCIAVKDDLSICGGSVSAEVGQHHGGVRPRADAAEFDDLIPPKGPVLVTGAT